MSLRFIAGVSVCAVAATLASTLPFFIATADFGEPPDGVPVFLVAVAGILNCLIGLPVSTTAYSWMLRNGMLSLKWVLGAANVCGVVLALLASIALGGRDFLFLGLPTILAANTWAICGWYLVARPELRRLQSG